MTPTCPSCGDPMIAKMTTPNGTAYCARGHGHPAASFKIPTLTENDAYRSRMEAPMEALAIEAGNAGIDHPMLDHELVEFAVRKIAMLREMILATGFSENLLKAVMKG